MRTQQTPVLVGRLVVALALTLASAGCQSGGLLAGNLAPEEKVRRADALLADAAGATATQRLLSAAVLYNSAQAYAKARDALNRIDTRTLPRNQRAEFLLAAADADLGLGDLTAAWATLARPPEGRHGFTAELDAADAARVGERRAQLLERRGQTAAAARERALAGRDLPAAMQGANEQALWTLLQQMSREALRQMENATEPDVSAWAALARVMRDAADSPALLAARLDAWMLEHPDHPAARRPPAAVREARRIDPGAGPAQIAVLLPRHGKLAPAGDAIERGLVTAWYLAREQGAAVPALRFYDSAATDFLATYDAAVRDGAQVVIGPLEKENLKLLQDRGRLPVATIALNYPDAEAQAAPAGLYFFGLSGEDEAAQIAQQALAAGYRRCIALVPAGEWGERIAAQLARSLQAGGGELRGTGVYQGNGDYSDVVRNLVGTALSELRHDRIERVTGLELGFVPQRRQDVDCLFIIGNTLQGTQLAPAVQYHHAADLPLFSTSHINGQPTASSSRDLSGIRFVEMPWIADPGHALRTRVEKAWKDVDARYIRLYALGVDAWRLGLQVPVFSGGGEIEGVTGRLRLEPGQHIQRRLESMVFRGGAAEPLDETAR